MVNQCINYFIDFHFSDKLNFILLIRRSDQHVAITYATGHYICHHHHQFNCDFLLGVSSKCFVSSHPLNTGFLLQNCWKCMAGIEGEEVGEDLIPEEQEEQDNLQPPQKRLCLEYLGESLSSCENSSDTKISMDNSRFVFSIFPRMIVHC